MSSLRERHLAEGIKNKMLGIQKSEQIYVNLSKWKKKLQIKDEEEIEKIAISIAAKVEQYAIRIKAKTGNEPSPELILAKIKKELEHI